MTDQESGESLKPTAVICDLDGTLALIGDRDPYAAQKCSVDTVNEPVAMVLKWARAAGHAILLVSGRGFQASHRTATERWLARHQIGYDELLLRPTFDRSKDYDMKLRIYRDQIRPRYRVVFVMDDRGSVVQMWRREGLTVFQVDDPDE